MNERIQHLELLRNDIVIRHHGVKGMKWGIIRDRVKSAAKKAGQAISKGGKAVGRAASKGGKAAARRVRGRRVTDMDQRELQKKVRKILAERDLESFLKDKNIPRASRKQAKKMFKKRKKYTAEEIETKVSRLRQERIMQVSLKGDRNRRAKVRRDIFDSAVKLGIDATFDNPNTAAWAKSAYDVKRGGVGDNVGSISKQVGRQMSDKRRNRG